MALKGLHDTVWRLNFMEAPYRVSFIGHGVGLEIDELPILPEVTQRLAVGNVVAIEPKLVFPGRGR